MSVSFITCTRDRVPRSLYKNIPIAHELIVKSGAKSLAEGYNKGAKDATGDILVFLHDDLELMFSPRSFYEFELKLKNKNYGIGGVVGSRKLSREKIWPPLGGFGSGGCLHQSNGYRWYTTMGLFGRTLWLDGVFLAMRTELYDELEGFDEEIPGWHWYDVDISLRSHLLGYHNFTYPLQIAHGIDNYENGVRKDLRDFNEVGKIFWKKHEGFYPMTVDCDNQELENLVFSREPRWGQTK